MLTSEFEAHTIKLWGWCRKAPVQDSHDTWRGNTFGGGKSISGVPDLANISGNIGLQNARRRDNKPLYLGRAI